MTDDSFQFLFHVRETIRPGKGSMAYRVNSFLNSVGGRKVLVLPLNQETRFFNRTELITLFRSRISIERTGSFMKYLNALLFSLDSSRIFRKIMKRHRVHGIYGFGIASAVALELLGRTYMKDIDQIVFDIFETELFHAMFQHMAIPAQMLRFLDLTVYNSLLENENARILSLTETMREYLAKHFGIRSGKIQVMYQTADPGMYLEPHTFDEKMKEPTIVFMGDVYFRDGIDVAVKALKLVKKEMPKIKLVITGGGPYVPNVLSLARRLDVMEDIQLTGWLSFDDLLVLLQRAALGLVPWRDSLANRIVIPEKTYGYMAAGTPVVASKLKAIQEIIEHKKTGVLVTPEDPCELADGILSILGCRRFYEEIQSHARDAMLSHNRSVAKLTAEIFDSKKYFR